MKRRTLTGRMVRMLALLALVMTPVVVMTATGSASAADVGDQDALQDAFEDGGVTQIDLTANIVIDYSGNAECDDFTRDSDNSLLIDGHGFSIVKDEADCAANGEEGERIFEQRDDGTITFKDVTVSGGTKIGGSGGALKTEGPVVVQNSTFSNNSALMCDYDEAEGAEPSGDDVEAQGRCYDPYGGAIFAEGSVDVTTSVFSNNHADSSGGGIFTEANIVVSGTQFSGNSAGGPELGECWCSGGGFLTLGGANVSGSAFEGNSAGCEAYCDGSGGGFWAAGAASVVGTTLSNNTAGCEWGCAGQGGGFFASGESSESDAASSELAAAAADPGEVIVSGSTFTGNVARCDFDLEFANSQGGDLEACGSGGGFYTEDADLVDVSQSTFAGNQALCNNPETQGSALGDGLEVCGGGGGFATFYTHVTNVNASTFNDNVATLFGGAIAHAGYAYRDGACNEGVGCDGFPLSIVNSTVTANQSGILGAITSPVAELVHDTIVGNWLSLGGLGPAAAGEFHLGANLSAFFVRTFGTINTGGFGEGILGLVTENCLVGHVNSEGWNFSDDESCELTDPTDIVDTPNDPELEALGNYGGPTQTMRPMGEIDGATGLVVSLSPVVDRIPAADCVLDVDQRGVARPQEIKTLACDIGSVEITAEEITVGSGEVKKAPGFTG